MTLAFPSGFLVMSHYDCVLPVDFERLRDVVLPAWIEFIADERAPRDFADEFAPHKVDVADIEFWGEDNWLEPFSLPPAYIEWFRERPITEWNAEAVRREVGHLRTRNSLPWCADNLLVLALKQSCAVELLPEVPFAQKTAWNRLSEFPFVQVAGTKNRFWFLEELYEWSWEHRSPFYTLKRNGRVQDRTYVLLERLFFNVRVFPGTLLMSQSLVWKASDELQIPGFLSTDETHELAGLLPELKAVARNLEGRKWVFDLFVDCVQRAASCRAGLVTIFDGL